MELDEILIECPICDRSVPATSKKCQFCGTELSTSGLDELEELALHVDDFYHESPLPAAEKPEVSHQVAEGPEESKANAGKETIPEVSDPAGELSEGQEPEAESAEGLEELPEAPKKPISIVEVEQERRERNKERKGKKISIKAEKKEKKALRKREKREKKLNRKASKSNDKDGGTTEEGSH